MVVFTTVVFVLRIAEICMVLLHMVLHTWTTAAEPLISSSAVVQEGSPTDLWFCLLFQSKEWLILSKWLASPSSSSAVNQEGWSCKLVCASDY